MSDDPRDRSLEDETLRYLEVLLASIVYGAGAYANTILDFLFRPARFEAAILTGPSGQLAGHRGDDAPARTASAITRSLQCRIA